MYVWLGKKYKLVSTENFDEFMKVLGMCVKIINMITYFEVSSFSLRQQKLYAF